MKNKIIVITGSSSGLGSTLVKDLCVKHQVIGLSRNNNEFNEQLSNFKYIKTDISNSMDVKNAFEQINYQFGKIDILINNAAISQEKPFEGITDDDFDKMMNVNLRGPFSLAQELIPDMVTSKWGIVVNIVSIGGQWGGYNQVHYAASKAALINFTQSIAKIYSAHGITSNAISPGLVATDMTSFELNTTLGRKKVSEIPIKRLGTAKEIGAAAVYLVSDEAAYITGQTINLNGGMLFS